MAIGVATGLLSLQACGVPDQGNSPAPKREIQPGVTASMTQDENEELQAEFEKRAPEGWELLRFDRHSAQYKVSIPPLSTGRAPVEASGQIVPAGVSEEMVQLGDAIPQWTSSSDEEIKRASELYPDHVGYIKRVSVGTYGYDIKYGKHIHRLEYFSIEKHISCWGEDPGQFICYWGAPRKTFLLSFDSKNLQEILKYVINIADMER